MAALAYGKLKLSPVEKTKLVFDLCEGKTSFRELTNPEADRVINELKRRAGQVPMRPVAAERRRARAQGVTALVTPAQRELLEELTRGLRAAELTAAYLDATRLRACGRPFPKTAAEAERAIEALKALQARVTAGWRPQELA
jgi:hypothetical protein